MIGVGALIAAGVGLAGCSSLGGNAPQTYDLTAPRGGPRRGAARGQLLVVEPKALASLDTERIAVRNAAGALSYLPDAAWSDKLPRLLQARLIQSFENANRLASVGRPGDRLSSDWQLLSDVRAFEVVAEGSPRALVELSVKLVNDRSGRILAANVFRAEASTASIDARAVNAAFDQAAGQVFLGIVGWTIQRV